MVDPEDALARIRRPKYTGENRCLPCTAVNVALASGAALVVAALASRIAAGAIFGGCLLLIYLRGYLVPGTPQITAAYFPERVLGLFGKTNPDVDVLEDTDETTERLLRAGVLGRDRSGDLQPASDFLEALRRRVRETSPSAAAVVDALGATDADQKGEWSFVVDDNERLRWESEAALVADLAAAAILRDRFDEWSSLDPTERANLLRVVRGFLTYCPRCGGRPTVERQRIDPCCRPARETVRSECAECGVNLLETAVRDDDADWFDALPARE